MLDFYSIKYNAGDQYNLLKETVIQQGEYYGTLYTSDTGCVYHMEQVDNSSGITIIVFDDVGQLFSLVYIYGADDVPFMVDSVMYQHSHIPWVYDYQVGQGDGSLVS